MITVPTPTAAWTRAWLIQGGGGVKAFWCHPRCFREKPCCRSQSRHRVQHETRTAQKKSGWWRLLSVTNARPPDPRHIPKGQAFPSDPSSHHPPPPDTHTHALRTARQGRRKTKAVGENPPELQSSPGRLSVCRREAQCTVQCLAARMTHTHTHTNDQREAWMPPPPPPTLSAFTAQFSEVFGVFFIFLDFS